MKTTSITIRFNNGEIEQGVEALRAFCLAVLGKDKTSPIADAMLKTYNATQRHGELRNE